MTKIIEIENCIKCPYRFRTYYCQHPKQTLRIIKETPIPSWCPLPDKPEPFIETEELARIRQGDDTV